MLYKFVLPIRIGKALLNMNNYRNNHYQVNAKHKRQFAPISTEWWEGQAERITIEYQVYKKTNRRYDIMNIISIVDKYFLDCLVTQGKLTDDACNNVAYARIKGVKGADTDCVIAYIRLDKEV